MSASPARTSTKPKPARKGWRRFFSLKRILLVLLGLFLLGVAAFGVAYATINVPQPNDMANAQASIIYYDDGKTELDRLSEIGGNRESVPLSRIPVHVRNALLAAEDRSFYENNGVSPSGIARSVVVALKGGATQGGSTITQQYVKNYFLTQDRTITRKAKEFIISIKIDQQESKEKILENYLNTIYYGRGAEGIQTASKAYFGHSASRLTVAEGALLASVIRGPSFYDPALGAKQKASAIARVDYVLDGMVTQGWLTPAERTKTRFPKTIRQARFTKAGHGPNGYITNEVRAELTNKLGLTETDIDRGGLRIVTTIDKKAQDAALKAVADKMPSGKAASKLHVGLTAIRPGDGAVVAMYGGSNSRQFNTSTQATLQGGSTFKVFGLLAALQKDISTKTQYAGYSPRFIPEFEDRENPRGRVKNFEGHQYGKVTLRTALADSVNTVFAQLNVDLADGDKTATGVRDAAILAGLPKTCPPRPKQTRTCTPGLGTDMTNILGTASPHVIDMANAYATIAAQGRRATPYLITKVTSSDRRINYRVRKKLTPAFDKSVTADVTEAMRRVVTEGTGTGALELGRPAAGKTGTAEETTAVWFNGFTPQLSAAVGIYHGKGGTEKIPQINGHQISSGGLPVDIWTAFMKGALEGEDVIDFPSREGVGDELLPPPPPPPTTPPPTTPPPTTPPPTTAPGAPTTAPAPGPTGPVPTGPVPTGPGPTGPGQGGGPIKTPGPPDAPPTIAP